MVQRLIQSVTEAELAAEDGNPTSVVLFDDAADSVTQPPWARSRAQR